LPTTQRAKYIDPKSDYHSAQENYIGTKAAAEDVKHPEVYTDFNQQNFTNQVGTLIVLLALSDRRSGAEIIVADSKTVSDDIAFVASLDEALKEKVPEPWPPSIN
jgi:hypothetical protein